jgi:4-hydroxy-3-methylbut-2-enyl diphosphate reductase
MSEAPNCNAHEPESASAEHSRSSSQSRSSHAPRIVVASSAGACFGVNRALDLVREAAEGHPGEVRTLGPLIHNPRVVDELAQLGASAVSEPEEAAGKTLVLRTHGVTPQVEVEAQASCQHVIDATCPFVKRAHRAVERLSREGYQLIVVGEPGHPEVEGTVGHAPGALVIPDASALDGVELSRRVGVVVQTTMTLDSLRSVVSALLAQVDELRVVNTICDATAERQESAARLAAEADVMIVVGGKSSANTRHLAEVCAQRCSRTHHIEHECEIDPAWLMDAQLIGVTAGASTPAAHIDAVVSALNALTSSTSLMV